MAAGVDGDAVVGVVVDVEVVVAVVMGCVGSDVAFVGVADDAIVTVAVGCVGSDVALTSVEDITTISPSSGTSSSTPHVSGKDVYRGCTLQADLPSGLPAPYVSPSQISLNDVS